MRVLLERTDGEGIPLQASILVKILSLNTADAIQIIFLKSEEKYFCFSHVVPLASWLLFCPLE